jgi:hypothetical protein
MEGPLLPCSLICISVLSINQPLETFFFMPEIEDKNNKVLCTGKRIDLDLKS